MRGAPLSGTHLLEVTGESSLLQGEASPGRLDLEDKPWGLFEEAHALFLGPDAAKLQAVPAAPPPPQRAARTARRQASQVDRAPPGSEAAQGNEHSGGKVACGVPGTDPARGGAQEQVTQLAGERCGGACCGMLGRMPAAGESCQWEPGRTSGNQLDWGGMGLGDGLGCPVACLPACSVSGFIQMWSSGSSWSACWNAGMAWHVSVLGPMCKLLLRSALHATSCTCSALAYVV